MPLRNDKIDIETIAGAAKVVERRDAARNGFGATWLSKLERQIFGPPLPAHLPRHVTQVLYRRQWEGEVLVGTVQLAAVGLFAILYMLVPKPLPAKLDFEPVPVILFLYTLFTSARIYLAVRDRLTPVILVISIIIDGAVLYGTLGVPCAVRTAAELCAQGADIALYLHHLSRCGHCGWSRYTFC